MYSPNVGTGTAMRSIRRVLMSTISSVAPLPMIRFSGLYVQNGRQMFLARQGIAGRIGFDEIGKILLEVLHHRSESGSRDWR